MYAVDFALRETGIQLYYCQPEQNKMAQVELEESYSQLVNDRVRLSNFDALEKINNQVRRLSWPFDQREIELKNLPLVDSKYYFAWLSDWSEYDFVSKVEVKITLSGAGNIANFVYYPLYNPDATIAERVSEKDIALVLKDESGLSMLGKNNVSVSLYKVMGELDRMEAVTGESDENGVVNFGKRQVGRYYYMLYVDGRPADRYDQLCYTARGWIEVGLDSATPTEMIAFTKSKSAELFRAFGLLRELRELEIYNDRIGTFVENAGEWLEGLKENGLTLVELEAVKRFNTALAAIVNCSGYACTVQTRASDDALKVVEKINGMIRKAEEIVEKLESAKQIIMTIVNTFIDIITGNWSGAASNLTIQELVDRLVNYVKNDLLDDIMETVEQKLAEVIRDPEKIIDYFQSYVKDWVKQKLSPDQIRDNVYNFVEEELVYEKFTSHMEQQIEKVLFETQKLVEENIGKHWDIDERSSLIRESFYQMRNDLMSDLFDVSYKALSEKDSIDDWESCLSTLRELIPLIVEFIELFEIRYPELSSIKAGLETLYEALDTIGTLTKTYELALKVDYLNPLSERIQQISEMVFQFK